MSGVSDVIVYRRTGGAVEMREGRDHWWHALDEGVSEVCPAEQLDSEHPLYGFTYPALPENRRASYTPRPSPAACFAAKRSNICNSSSVHFLFLISLDVTVISLSGRDTTDDFFAVDSSPRSPRSIGIAPRIYIV